MNSKLNNVDIMIPTYYKDFVWLEYLLKSLKKFASGFRKIIVVTDDDGNILPDNIKNIVPIELIYVKMLECPKSIEFRPGYFWQQYLSLNWMEYSDADTVLILHSDGMLTEKLTPNDLVDSNNRFRWFYRRWADAGEAIVWKLPSEQALKHVTTCEAMCMPGFIFEKHTTMNFINYMKKIHNASSLWDCFFKYNPKLFSEFNVFGSFILYFDNQMYSKILISNDNLSEWQDTFHHKILSSWSYGGLTNDDKIKRDLILNN